MPIVGDGALAGPVAHGRLVPLLILDTSNRPDVREVLRVHEHLPPGDVTFHWAYSRDSDDEVALDLRFIRPMDVKLLLRFSIERQAILVEAMLNGQGVWVQAGAPGDRLATTMDAHRVLVELPDTGFQPTWDKLWLKRMTRVVARRQRISRRKARPLAKNVIEDLRGVARLRLKA